MKSELSIVIDRPIAEVFDYTLNHVSEWSIVCVEDEVIDQKPGEVGTTFRMVTEERGQRIEFRGVVQAYEPPTRSVAHLESKQFDIDVEYLFADVGGRTRVIQRSAVTGKGMIKVMFVLFGWLMKKSSCKAQESELASLKRHCEARGQSDASAAAPA